MENFKVLGLSEKNLDSLKKKGFEEPTEIQTLTIPVLLRNDIDIIAQAQTGTGKTAAFALPLIEKLNPKIRKTQVIILAPTRELVIQVCEEINSLKGDSDLTIASIYGGQSIDLQLRKLQKGIHIVVGTPGRVLDHIRRRTLKLDAITHFILDEADEMLNMGFIEDIETVLKETPKSKRVLLFSATMPDRIKKLAENYMGEYEHIKTKTKLASSLTDQIYFEVNNRDKFEALCRIIDIEEIFYGLIFCRTKNDVDDIVSRLIERAYPAEGLHGDISQAQREKTLNRFRDQQITILAATDVASRGIDVTNLTHVINYSIPHDPESYIHRIGRTGRAGNQGTAITFVTSSEFRKLGFIQKVTKEEIRKADVPEIDEIIKSRKTKINGTLERIIEADKLDDFSEWAGALLDKTPPNKLIAAILKYAFGKSLDPNKYKKIGRRRGNDNRLMGERGHTRLFIAMGNNETTKKELVKFIVNKTGVPKHVIEDVAVLKEYSFITVPFTEAEIILKKFKKRRKGRQALIEKAKKA